MPVKFPDGTTIPSVSEFQFSDEFLALDDAGKQQARVNYLKLANDLGRAQVPGWGVEHVAEIEKKFSGTGAGTGMGLSSLANPLAWTDVGRRISEGALNQAEAAGAALGLRRYKMTPEELQARIQGSMAPEAQGQAVAQYAAEQQQAVGDLARAVETQQNAPALIEHGEVLTVKGFLPAIAKTAAQSLLAMSAGAAKEAGAVGAVAPLSNPAAAIAAGFQQEFPLSMIELVQEQGYDLTNPADIEKLLSDPQARKDLEDAEKRAGVRGGVIALIDGVAQFIGAKGATAVGKRAATSGRGRLAREAGVEIGADVVGGGAGEVAARGAIGQEQSLEETILEAGGGLSQAPASLAQIAGRRVGGLEESTNAEVEQFQKELQLRQELIVAAKQKGVQSEVYEALLRGDVDAAAEMVDLPPQWESKPIRKPEGQTPSERARTNEIADEYLEGLKNFGELQKERDEVAEMAQAEQEYTQLQAEEAIPEPVKQKQAQEAKITAEREQAGELAAVLEAAEATIDAHKRKDMFETVHRDRIEAVANAVESGNLDEAQKALNNLEAAARQNPKSLRRQYKSMMKSRPKEQAQPRQPQYTAEERQQQIEAFKQARTQKEFDQIQAVEESDKMDLRDLEQGQEEFDLQRGIEAEEGVKDPQPREGTPEEREAVEKALPKVKLPKRHAIDGTFGSVRNEEKRQRELMTDDEKKMYDTMNSLARHGESRQGKEGRASRFFWSGALSDKARVEGIKMAERLGYITRVSDTGSKWRYTGKEHDWATHPAQYFDLDSRQADKPNDFFEGGHEALGSVPFQGEMKYRGFSREMKLSDFLGLAHEVKPDQKKVEGIAKKAKDGTKLGRPFIRANWNPQKKVWEATGEHEGRHRAYAAMSLGQDVATVDVFTYDENGHRIRANEALTDEQRSAPIVSSDTRETLQPTKPAEQPDLFDQPQEQAQANYEYTKTRRKSKNIPGGITYVRHTTTDPHSWDAYIEDTDGQKFAGEGETRDAAIRDAEKTAKLERAARLKPARRAKKKADWSTSKGESFELDGGWVVQLPDGTTINIYRQKGTYALGWMIDDDGKLGYNEIGNHAGLVGDTKKEAIAKLKQMYESGELQEIVKKINAPRKSTAPKAKPRRKGQRGGASWRKGKRSTPQKPSVASQLGGEYTDAVRLSGEKETFAERFTALKGESTESFGAIGRGLSYVFEPVKNRLRRIDSHLYAKIMRSAFNAQSLTQKDMERVEGFLKAVDAIPLDADRKALKRAQISGDSAAIRTIAKHYGFMDDYLKARSVIDNLLEISASDGMDVDDVTKVWIGGKKLTKDELAAKDLMTPAKRAEFMKKKGYTLASGNEMLPGGSANNGRSRLSQKEAAARDGLTEYEYWPRSLHDYNDMRKQLGLKEVTDLEKAIKEENARRAKVAAKNRERLEVLSRDPVFQKLTKKERMEKMQDIGIELELESGKPMTPREENIFVAEYISGASDRNPVSRASNNFFGSRQFDSVPLSHARFYEDPSVAMTNLIRRVYETTEKRKALGITPEIEQVGVQQAIGERVNEMLKNGDITNQQIEATRNILTAYYNNTAIPSYAKLYKNMENLVNLANSVSAMIQFADVAFTLWRYGLRMPIKTMKAIGKAFVGKGQVSLSQVGADSTIMADIINSAPELKSNSRKIRSWANTTDNWVDFAFKWSGFKKIDAIGKQALLNAAFEEAQSQAKKGKFDPQLQSLLTDAFDDTVDAGRYDGLSERETVIKDLKDGIMSDEVRYLMFLQLSEVQPISPLNMPERYLAGGALTKMSYQFLSFTMNRWGLLAQTATDKNRSKAERRMATAGLVLAAMASEIPAFFLQQMLLGRIDPFDEESVTSEEWDELLFSGMLRSLGFSRFMLNSLSSGNWVVGLSAIFPILPPMRTVEDTSETLMHGIDAAVHTERELDWKKVELIGATPLVGRLIDARLGGGRDTVEKNRKKISYMPQVDWLGRPIGYSTPSSGAGRIVSAFYSTITGGNRSDQYGVPKLKRPKPYVTRDGVRQDMTSEQWDAFLRDAGERTRRKLDERGMPKEWNEETHEVYKEATAEVRAAMFPEGRSRSSRSRRRRRRGR